MNRITELLAWAGAHFDQVGVFVPDIPTIWTLEAGGYTHDEATYKTQRQVRYLNNKTRRARDAVDSAGCPAALLPWSLVAQYPRYGVLEGRCRDAFATDRAFREECLEATDDVLENRRQIGHQLSKADRLRAVNYLMAELPLILFGPDLFDVPSATFVYHRSLPLFERLFSGAFAIRPTPGQHFVIAHELAEKIDSPITPMT